MIIMDYIIYDDNSIQETDSLTSLCLANDQIHVLINLASSVR
jgi:hypothetical protein